MISAYSGIYAYLWCELCSNIFVCNKWT